MLDLPGGDLQVREDGQREGRRSSSCTASRRRCTGGRRWPSACAATSALIRIDLLGHGGSEKPDGGYSMEHQAEQVSRALASSASQAGGDRRPLDGRRGSDRVRRAAIRRGSKDSSSSTLLREGRRRAAVPARLGFVPVLGQAMQARRPRRAGQDRPGEGVRARLRRSRSVRRGLQQMTYTSYDSSHDEVRRLQRRARARRPAGSGEEAATCDLQGAKDSSWIPTRSRTTAGCRAQRSRGPERRPLADGRAAERDRPR